MILRETATWVVLGLALALCIATGSAAGEQTVILNTSSFWRCLEVYRPPATGTCGKLTPAPLPETPVQVAKEDGTAEQKKLPCLPPGQPFTPDPPEDWVGPEFADGGWWRNLAPFLGALGGSWKGAIMGFRTQGEAKLLRELLESLDRDVRLVLSLRFEIGLRDATHAAEILERTSEHVEALTARGLYRMHQMLAELGFERVRSEIADGLGDLPLPPVPETLVQWVRTAVGSHRERGTDRSTRWGGGMPPQERVP